MLSGSEFIEIVRLTFGFLLSVFRLLCLMLSVSALACVEDGEEVNEE